MKKAIFLDRDGVVNNAVVIDGKPYPPSRIYLTHPIKGITQLVREWHKLGFLVLVVTNQPDVATGKTTVKRVEEINDYLKSVVHFDDIFICYHSEDDKCNCRKPKIGLFLEAKKKYDIDLSKTFMIGDRWKDIKAGHDAGCVTIFVDYGYKEKQPENNDFTIKNIQEIRSIINDRDIFGWG